MLPPESDVEDVTAISSELTAVEEEENDKQTKSGEEGEGQEGTGEEGEGGEGEGGEGEGGEGEGERGKTEGGSVGEGKEKGSKGKGSEEKEDIAKQIAVVKYLRVSGMETLMTCIALMQTGSFTVIRTPFHSTQDGLEFIKLMSSCIPVCTRLLGSKVNSDVLESLEFLSTAVEFQVSGRH